MSDLPPRETVFYLANDRFKVNLYRAKDGPFLTVRDTDDDSAHYYSPEQLRQLLAVAKYFQENDGADFGL